MTGENAFKGSERGRPDFWAYNPEIRDDARMVELLWDQRRELVELTARHAQDFIRLAMEIKKELQGKGNCRHGVSYDDDCELCDE